MTTTQEISPAISVLMPVYNGEKHLHEAIDSILAQTFTDFEFIIVDDGSTDATAAILAEYARRDSRIRILTNETNCKIAVSLNKGLAAAKAPLIARMDADDYSEPHRLETQHRHMTQNTHIDILGSTLALYETDDFFIPPCRNAEIRIQLLFQTSIYHPTVMYKRKTIQDVGCYSSEKPPAEDYDLWARLSMDSEIVFENLPFPLVKYRLGAHDVNSPYRLHQQIQANTVRKFLLDKLNIYPNDEELLLHSQLADHRFQNTPEFITSTKKWMDKLYTSNTFTKMYDDEKLLIYITHILICFAGFLLNKNPYHAVIILISRLFWKLPIGNHNYPFQLIKRKINKALTTATK